MISTFADIFLLVFIYVYSDEILISIDEGPCTHGSSYLNYWIGRDWKDDIDGQPDLTGQD